VDVDHQISGLFRFLYFQLGEVIQLFRPFGRNVGLKAQNPLQERRPAVFQDSQGIVEYFWMNTIDCVSR
jgi:hypothetical protein